MNTTDLIAIDTHTHLEVSCWNPFDSQMEFATLTHTVEFSG